MSGWVIFAIVFLAVGALLVVFTAWVIALSLLRPPRMTDGKAMYVLRRLSPADLGLPFEVLRFTVRDPRSPGSTLQLVAWWIAASMPSPRCVVFLHGYADAKVGAIAWAPLWREMGFNVLAIDLRAHGESEGKHTTGGCFERDDLVQALDQLRATHPRETEKIVLLGISLGSAVALAAAERRPDLVDAIVLECPFASFPRAATSHATRLGSPTHIVMPLALRLAEIISGARFDDIRPIKLIAELAIPMLLIQSANDSFVGAADAELIAAAARKNPKATVWRVENSEHLLALASQPEQYAQRLADFLHAALTPARSEAGEHV